MIKHPKIGVIAALLMAASVLFICAGYFFPSAFENISGSSELPYVAAMDKTEVLDIEIIADEKEWAYMLENALDEEYIPATIMINGVKIEGAGIRPKGNSSLSMVAQDDTTDRYSFKIEFDQYVSGQTWLGLDKLVLNNIQGDATYMKEYLSYDLMDYAGVETPLYTFSNISVNGETWGFYLAVEALEDSYAQRVYGKDHGKLYKPEGMEMMAGGNERGNMGQIQMPEGFTAPEGFSTPEESSVPEGFSAPEGFSTPEESSIPEGFSAPEGFSTPEQGEWSSENLPDMGFGNLAGGFGRGTSGQAGGASLQYTDDLVSSYSSIFENAVFDSTEQDYKRVIHALEKLNSGEDLENAVDVEATLQYFAAHTVIVNLDSYVSNMCHNYYLYEKNGQLTILPWDFNLAFGGFQSGDASSVVNFPIDTPVSGVSLEDRPILGKLLEVPEYLELYHTCLQQIIDGYFNSGLFLQTINSLDTLIGPYVADDPTAFYDYISYQTAVTELEELGTLRAQSIEGQLNGSIPATTAEQTQNPDTLVDASAINLSALGSMGGMGGMGNRSDGGGEGGFGNRSDRNGEAGFGNWPDGNSEANTGNWPGGNGEINAGDPPARNGEANAGNLPDRNGETGNDRPMSPDMEGSNRENTPSGGNIQEGENNFGFRGNFNSQNISQNTAAAFQPETWIVTGVLTLLLLGGLCFVIFYKRRA